MSVFGGRNLSVWGQKKLVERGVGQGAVGHMACLFRVPTPDIISFYCAVKSSLYINEMLTPSPSTTCDVT